MSEPEDTTPLDSTADTVVVETVVTTEVVILEDDKAEEVIAATESVAQAESNESSDSAALIADLRAQVAALTQKVASLEAKLALAERANEAAAAPRLVHATKARAGPRRAKAASTEDHADQENEEAPNANRDATTPEPHDGAENEEPTTPQQAIQKKIATMGGVSAFGGAGFNPFAGGASPNVLLKSRSSVTNSSVGGPSEAEAAEALGKADEVKEWVGTTLGDENVKNATNEVFCGELLKDGTLLCRLVSTVFPSHAAKSKPGKFLFVHKENLGNYFKACTAAGVSQSFEYEDLIDEKRYGYVFSQLLSLKHKAEQTAITE